MIPGRGRRNNGRGTKSRVTTESHPLVVTCVLTHRNLKIETHVEIMNGDRKDNTVERPGG